MDSADVAIIGGTTIIDTSLLDGLREVEVHTPYGRPSDTITLGSIEGVGVAVLPRHGRGHTIPPHLINFRANVDALHQLGVKRIVATAAVGSLKDEFRAGDIVIPDQFIDWSKEVHGFYGDGKFYHVSMADPFCPEVRQTLIETCKKLGLSHHETGTYLKIDGPQLSTRAASRMYRQFADIIGMTCIPEAILARERQMCLAVLATVTDYDVWAERPVRFDEIRRVISQNAENTKKVLHEAVKSISKERGCACQKALEGAAANL